MAIGTIGKYERLDVLGHGTSGVVYLAWDNLLRRQVALKEIRAAEPEWERVLEEARVLDRLGRHPNIVHVNGVDHENGAILIDMELVKGRNLAETLRLRSGEPLMPRDAIRIARAVLSALEFAHEKRIIHRDVKPANILIGDDGQTIKLTDFGLAEALGTGSVAGGGGTYPYMAPEDFADDDSSDYRSDLWAVGVVLYEMLAGKRPFAVAPRPGSTRAANADPFAWKQAIEQTEPPHLLGTRPGISRELDEVVLRALAKNKTARYASAQIFSDALASALRTLPDVPLHEQVTFVPPAFDLPDITTSARLGAAVAAVPIAPAPWAPGEPFVFAGGATVARSLDDLLVGAAKHWDEGRVAFLDGRMEQFLRSIGEIYIADFAHDLAARMSESPDKRFREFLTRSQASETESASVTSSLDVSASAPYAPYAPGDDATVAFRPGRRLLRRRVAESPHPLPLPRDGRGETKTANGVSVAAFVGSGDKQLNELPSPVAGEGQGVGGLSAVGRGPSKNRWWFWPLFLLCLAPLVCAFDAIARGNGYMGTYTQSGRTTALLAGWAASGFCAALLLLVGIGARFPLMARIVCALPVLGGLVAVGALFATANARGNPSPDNIVRLGIALLAPLAVLLFVAGTVGKLWKLWAWIVVLCALATSVPFLS